MGCKGSQVQILSPRPISRASSVARGLRVSWAGPIRTITDLGLLVPRTVQARIQSLCGRSREARLCVALDALCAAEARRAVRQANPVLVLERRCRSRQDGARAATASPAQG